MGVVRSSPFLLSFFVVQVFFVNIVLVWASPYATFLCRDRVLLSVPYYSVCGRAIAPCSIAAGAVPRRRERLGVRSRFFYDALRGCTQSVGTLQEGQPNTMNHRNAESANFRRMPYIIGIVWPGFLLNLEKWSYWETR